MPLAQVTAWATPARVAECSLQFLHRRAQNETAVLEHPRDGGVDVGLEAPVLRIQVDEGDGVAAGVVIGG